ncbi:glycosyltransferase family 1 protein [Desulfitibacter alkalitolerans]|uniref:glycosyltransferase family 1 protein n=1 Tax=Desulfitibacter alkalitolerans TaxID=264641 RepID=UPI000487F9D9|nr:glycosyltransferase family 1 protein [Desulfitibacter alkalitolerans]
MRKTRVLALCLSTIPSATVGVIKPLQEIEKRGLLEFRFKESLKVNKSDIVFADVVIFIRGSEDLELDLAKECRKLHKYNIYFLDDDLPNITETSNSYIYYSNKVVQNNILSIMKQCDGLWTTNLLLLDKYKCFFQKASKLDAPALLADMDINIDKIQDKIKIGFAGGLDHKYFIDTFLEAPIKDIYDRFSDRIEFQFFGVKPSFHVDYPVIYLPYETLHDKYSERMHSLKWDIGLAPLPQTDFHACKYFNKFLEYGALGIAGVYSNVEPYKRIVVNNINGMLTDNDKHQWINAISYLIQNPNHLLRIKNNVLKQVREQFNLTTISNDVCRAFPELTEYKAPSILEQDVCISCCNKNYWAYKLINLIKREGLNSAKVLLQKILEKARH